MAENTKLVTFDALQAASAYIATKAEVTKQIQDASLGGATLTYATTDEVVSLFQDTAEPTA